MTIPVIPIVSNSVTVWDLEVANELYSDTFFGKPLGMRKTEPNQRFDRPLSLSFFDSLYLQIQQKIELKMNDRILTTVEITKYFSDIYEDFKAKFEVYAELRDLGYIVKPGMKFGTDFIVYEKGPGLDHSKYTVIVENDSIKLRAINIVRAGRLSHSVKKIFLIAVKRNNNHRYFSFTRFKL